MKSHVQIVSNNSGTVIKNLNANLSREIAKATLTTEALAKTTAPVDTGALRNSITSNIERNKGTVSVGVDYAAHVEFGTRYQRAQPYLLPAFRKAVKQLKQALAGSKWGVK